MKSLHLIPVLIMLLSISCKKNDEIKPDIEYSYLPFIIAGQDTSAGVNYVNVDPDIYLFSYDGGNGETELLDLNDDDIPDFKIEMKHTPESLQSYYDATLSIIPLENCRVCVLGNKAYPFQRNDTISNYREWSASTAILYDYSEQYYPFRADTTGFWYERLDLYVGVEILKDDHWFYGWISINGKNNAITEYAVTIPYTTNVN